MTEARYDLVILNHTSSKPTESVVQDLLLALDKVGDSYLEYKLSEALLFEKSSSIIMDNITPAEGEIYQMKFRQLHVETELRPTLQLVAKEEAAPTEDQGEHICPACQHSQPKQSDPKAMNTCDNCGVVGEKFQQTDRRQEIYLQEKHRLEQAQNKQLNDSLAQAQFEEEQALRSDARKRLGVNGGNKLSTALAGIAIVAGVGATAYFVLGSMSGGTTYSAGAAGNSGLATTDQSSPAEPQADNAMLTIASNSINTDTVYTTQSTRSRTQGIQDLLKLAAVSPSELPGPAETLQNAQVLQGTISTPEEIDSLKQLLQRDGRQPGHVFKIQSEQAFNEDKERLNRLLDLDKPDLALVFTESMNDPYLASLLVLEIALHEKAAGNTALNDTLVLSMKTLMAKGNGSTSEKALLNASMSQIYDLTGDKSAAHTMLERSLNAMSSAGIDAEQSCQLLTQIDNNHRKFGNQDGADRMTATLINFVRGLPEQEYRARAEIYTHLAATALQEGRQQDAIEWLKHVPTENAQKALLAELGELT